MTKKKEIGRAAGLYDRSKSYSPELDDLRLWEIMNKYENPSYPAPEGEGFDFPLINTKQNVFDYHFTQKPAAHFGEKDPSALSQGNVRLDTIPMQRGDSESAFKASQNTEEYKNGLKKEIAELEEKLKIFDENFGGQAVNHPLFGLAMRRLINNQDATLLNSINTAIENEKNRKHTAAENEKNRQNTLDVAKLNKAEQEAAKKQDLEDAAERAADVYMSLKRKLGTIAKDDARYSEIEDQLDTAKILMKQAYRKAGKLSEYDKVVNKNEDNDKNLSELKTLLYRMHGATDDDNFKNIYTAADAERRKVIEHDAELLKIPMSKLPIAGIKGVADVKNEQNKKAQKKKEDFQKANKTKKFEMNLLTGKPKDRQAAESWLKQAREAGWKNIEIQSSGIPLWK